MLNIYICCVQTALAVGDVKELEDEAELMEIQTKIEMILYLQYFMPLRWRLGFMKRSEVIKPGDVSSDLYESLEKCTHRVGKLNFLFP